jgi:hypothetical protein
MEEGLYQPVPTCDIPMPILEGAPACVSDQAALPRILLQAAGTEAASWRVVLLIAVFLALSLLEILLIFRIPTADPLIVYGDFPRIILMEPPK